MKVGEALRKFDLLPIDRDRTKGRLLTSDALGQVVPINGEKPTHVGACAFEKACGPSRLSEMRFVAADASEHEPQHIEKVNTNIGRHPTRLAVIALPGGMIPAPARGDVAEFNYMPFFAVREPVTQRDDRRVQPKLQNGRYPTAGIALDLCETVNVPWIEDERLFTYGVGPVRIANLQ